MCLYWVSVLLELVVLFFVGYILARPIIRGAVYFPTKPKNVELMMNFLDLNRGCIVDLGSGDGRIVIALAKRGIEAHGYEINPLLVLYSRLKIRSLGLEQKACIHWKSFWRVDFSKFDGVIVYGFPSIMYRLGKKLEKELKPQTKIISNMYQFPAWKYDQKTNGVYLYSVK